MNHPCAPMLAGDSSDFSSRRHCLCLQHIGHVIMVFRFGVRSLSAPLRMPFVESFWLCLCIATSAMCDAGQEYGRHTFASAVTMVSSSLFAFFPQYCAHEPGSCCFARSYLSYYWSFASFLSSLCAFFFSTLCAYFLLLILLLSSPCLLCSLLTFTKVAGQR